ncbi:MAG: hypothetical protein O3A10_04670 [Chloroflexi bacterium]|nr:hypothetical protein [Chloroflexota bacterium]MDA1145567.1 hypothetical protein [Chloroflexota bacterium]
MAKALPYSQGDLVVVPLRDSKGFAVGLVTVHDGRGIVVAYFFGMRFPEVPSLDDVADLGRSDVICVRRFGDNGLITRKWLVLGLSPRWNEEEWPLPNFCRNPPLLNKPYRVIYSPENLARPIHEFRIRKDECEELPPDSLAGSGAIEISLTQLLASR